MDFNEEELRAQALAYVAAGGEWKKLANRIGCSPNNLGSWARGNRGLVARVKLAKIPAAIEKLAGKEGGSK